MKNKITIAIDAMGGENAPDKTILGLSIFYKREKNVNKTFFLLYGNEELILKKIHKYKLPLNNIKIFNTETVVSDEETPLTAVKSSKNSSMWNSIQSQISHEADISLSAGNTGVLFVISRMLLKTIDQVSKPALAGLWPSKKGTSVVLDLGANIECDENNLVDFSEMGSALYRSLFPENTPNVALLNIGSEEIKGTEIIKKAYTKLKDISSYGDFKFNGYIEGNNIMSGDVNVIVTDGFTGNIALKTAEGTANFIMKELKNSMTSNLYGKVLSFLNIKNLKKVKDKLDPRLYNGAILIGLTSPVVKSHGSTDYIGFSNSLKVCEKIVNGNLIEKIKNNIIT